MYTKLSEIEKELKSTFNFDALGLDVRLMANHIKQAPNESPLNLVYVTEDGKFEIDKKVREDLASLTGFQLTYCRDGREEISSVILFKTINRNDLKSVKTKSIRIGQLRELAKTIHPDAKIIDNKIATTMWYCASSFYTMKFLLNKKHFEFPGIMALCSIEEQDKDNSTLLDWNWSNGLWNYQRNSEKAKINADVPIWCYIELPN